MIFHHRAGARRSFVLAAVETLVPRHALASVLCAVLLSAYASGVRAATFYVDGANPACSDSGAGTEVEPYCTITAAMTAHNGPGVTILVKPAIYPEAVSVPKSGAAGNPFVLRGLGPGVVIEGPSRTLGITFSGRSWVILEGFTVRNVGGPSGYGYGIQAGGCSNIEIRNNTVSGVGGPYGWGIYVTAVSNMLLASNTVFDCGGHGIQLRSINNSIIEDNLSYRNLNGINVLIDYVHANGNLFQRNRLYDNIGSGLYLQYGTENNLCIQNMYWGNEHGIQHSGSTDCRHIGEVVWGNLDDGISLKNGSNGNSFSGCIVVDNGIGSAAYNLYADTASTAGLVSDDNIIWNSNSQKPIKFAGVAYSTVLAFSAATGQETRTIQADPHLLDPARGNFRLMQGSPAIDCGNSGVADWPAMDADGNARADDPAMPNVGLGPVDCAERGAFEFAPVGSPPVAVLHSISVGPLDWILDASASHDPDGNILWYSFDFGDGTLTGPQAESTASHTYAAGTWMATVTVADASGLVSTTSIPITTGNTAGVDDAQVLGFALMPLSPNPMRALGRVSFVVPRSAPVRLTVLDVQGRTIATLADRVHAPGRHEASWNARAARSGLYFLRLEAQGVSLVQRFVLEK